MVNTRKVTQSSSSRGNRGAANALPGWEEQVNSCASDYGTTQLYGSHSKYSAGFDGSAAYRSRILCYKLRKDLENYTGSTIIAEITTRLGRPNNDQLSAGKYTIDLADLKAWIRKNFLNFWSSC